MPNVDEFNFVLNHAERASPLWLRLKAQLQARLALKRSRNDNLLAPDETNELRGEIKCLKAILAFAEDPPSMPDEDDVDTLIGRVQQRRK